MWAAAWWTLISELLIGTLAFLVVWRVSGFLPKLLQTLRALVAALVMYAFLMAIPELHVIFKIISGAIVYGVVLILIGGPKPKDIIRLFIKQKAVIE